MKNKECDFILRKDLSPPEDYAWVSDCWGCQRDIDKTCPYGIYKDTIIEFK